MHSVVYEFLRCSNDAPVTGYSNQELIVCFGLQK